MKNGRDFLIVTNNPMVWDILADHYTLDYQPQLSYRDVLLRVRDLVYAGRCLYTHPISGSVKPNETPYRSVVVSKTVHEPDTEQLHLVGGSVITYDKFAVLAQNYPERICKDFQLIDYTLLCGALEFDAAAGLSKYSGKY